MYQFSPEYQIDQLSSHYDVIILGGGHNGLIAAAYLSKAGKRVLVVEKNSELGGATTSVKPFKGMEAYLSRYSYLVALLPNQIIQDLNLDFELLPRHVISYTPDPRDPSKGLLITHEIDQKKKAFEALMGAEAKQNLEEWDTFYESANLVAQKIAATFLEPLPTIKALKEIIPQEDWQQMIDMPIGKTLQSSVKDDLLQGIIATDALIGHFVDADTDFSANLCFLYHLVSDWKVPKGGMGRLVDSLIKQCQKNQTTFILNAQVTEIDTSLAEPIVKFEHQGQIYHVQSRSVLSNFAPQILNRLAKQTIAEIAPKTQAEIDYHVGAQVKVNLLLKRLPKLKSGEDPNIAFCGTFHVNELYSQLKLAYEQAKNGQIPDVIPCELYCHTLTDPSILSAELINQGYHTLTLFALQLPSHLFKEEPEKKQAIVQKKILDGLNLFLAEPIEDCLAVDIDGKPCIEFKLPQALEKEISLPNGNIFHRYFSKPFLESEENSENLRGIETLNPNIFLCGAGAIRGGGVSGIPGYHAAQKLLNQL